MEATLPLARSTPCNARLDSNWRAKVTATAFPGHVRLANISQVIYVSGLGALFWTSDGSTLMSFGATQAWHVPNSSRMSQLAPVQILLNHARPPTCVTRSGQDALPQRAQPPNISMKALTVSHRDV